MMCWRRLRDGRVQGGWDKRRRRAGHFGALLGWLRRNIHQYKRKHTPDELPMIAMDCIRRVTPCDIVQDRLVG